ncbi:MAG: SH3 domain-containing protein, partial [Deltaproteobacteria bacterium]|nr:SH3 domain-containing protein [Deltaproteobacteria bacterium]
MKKHLLITVVFLFSFACGATEKKIVTEVIDPYYQPKRVYSVGLEQAWESILKMLAEDRVPIQAVNKEEGLIRTDYQLTPEGSRYNFGIKILPGPQENTLIQIRCFYEARDEKDQFRDYTYSSPQQVTSLENGVYRRIESTLFIQEKQKETGEAEPGKKVKDPSPGPASAKAEAPSTQPGKELPSPGAPAAETAKEVPPGQPFVTYGTTKKTAILMREPSDDGPLLMALKKGTVVERMDQSGSWLKVRLPSGEIGWLPTDALQIAPLADTAKGADKPAAIKEGPLPFPEAKPEAAPPKPAAGEKIPPL